MACNHIQNAGRLIHWFSHVNVLKNKNPTATTHGKGKEHDVCKPTLHCELPWLDISIKSA